MMLDIDTPLSDATRHYIFLGEYENGEYIGKLSEYNFFINNNLMFKRADNRCIGLYSNRGKDIVSKLRNLCDRRGFNNTTISDVHSIGQNHYEFRIYFQDPSTIRDVLRVLKEVYLHMKLVNF